MRRNEFVSVRPLEPELPPAPQESDRAHLFTTAAGLLLPLGQALITGALAGLAAGCYAALLSAPGAWRWGVGVGVGVIVLAWVVMLWRWLDLTRPLEKLTGLDLNRDGHIAKPETIRVAVTSEDRKHTTIAELPYLSKLPDFARGVLAGDPISERHWSGAGALFSQSEYRQVRDLLLSRGWLYWNNADAPQQGLTLSPGGRAALRALASPTLSRADGVK